MPLLITRRPGESFLIGQDGEIKITILGIRKNQISLSIDAPKDIPVNREEIFERIQKEIRNLT